MTLKIGKKYYRDNAKKHRRINKELSRQYRNNESKPGETFSDFKRRMKRVKKTF
jgi:hypothetical protein